MSFYSADSPVWHPYTQMHNTEIIPIVSGKGAYVYDEQGNRYIDAVASWWTNLHGHAHPYIANAIAAQANKLEQVIFAGFTHEPAEQLAKKLLARIPFHQKIFYTDNGSTAVEVAIKMVLQYWGNKGEDRKKIICFRDAYHGDTFGSMSVSARGVFTDPFQKLLFDVEFIDTPNYTNETEILEQLHTLLTSKKDIAAFIFEPLVLGSAGMLMYKAELLNKLIAMCKEHTVLTISDEVMTGFGRTGKFLAVDHCENKPDIICLSKGITGGFLPFAATTCTSEVYNAFLSEERVKMLFHGHSYTANPLGCAASIASLEVFEQENTLAQIARIEKQHTLFAESIKESKAVKEIRQQGTILALELQTGDATGYLNNIRDKAYRFFIDRKIILRPLGNVIYILPPYCISDADLQEVYTAISDFIETV
ncbi:MAG TPA: adenosylmethionine--8-amino-7-oxononanoate transaminase [Chitinophagales bacterium]|nr:adenosylmethionine--8-amino-7-oxononanoate transaminase [Chitinophagales bacterium]